jgi:hypothetical protein
MLPNSTDRLPKGSIKSARKFARENQGFVLAKMALNVAEVLHVLGIHPYDPGGSDDGEPHPYDPDDGSDTGDREGDSDTLSKALASSSAALPDAQMPISSELVGAARQLIAMAGSVEKAERALTAVEIMNRLNIRA